MSVSLDATSRLHWNGYFLKFLYLSIFRNSRKILVSSRSDRINRYSKSVFLDRRAVARYRALASNIPGRERFSWKLSF